MNGRRTWRWLAAAALLAVGLGLHAQRAEAERRLQVWVQGGPPGCEGDPQNNRYMGEAQGVEAINTSRVRCEAISAGGTAMATCPDAPTLRHRVRIVKRIGETWAENGQLNASGFQNWNTAAGPIEAQKPADEFCPAITITAISHAR